jgi:hypothetical protein
MGRWQRTAGSATIGTAVRLELQADCLAGVWASGASRPAADGGEPSLVDTPPSGPTRRRSTPMGRGPDTHDWLP